MAATNTATKPRAYTDVRGVPVSYPDNEAIAGLEKAIEMSLSFRGDASAQINSVLEEHPDFIMAWLFKAGWLTQSMETRIYKAMVNALNEAEKRLAKANDREIGHFEAVKAWINGDFFGAVQKWEAVLVKYPRDLLAMELVHYTDVLLGDIVGQRDVVARASTLWDESIPGYEFVLGFYAFGLEENRDFSHAEELARQALAIRSDHPYAVHAVSHVMEMRGRQTGGVRFMAERENQYKLAASGLWPSAKTNGRPLISPITFGGTPRSITSIWNNTTESTRFLTTIWTRAARTGTNTKNWMRQRCCGVSISSAKNLVIAGSTWLISGNLPHKTRSMPSTMSTR